MSGPTGTGAPAVFAATMSAPLTRAGLVLGLGLGGFFDGIVLHQILGWHHLVCYEPMCRPDSVAQLERQNVQDGFFHLACYGLTLAGVVLLFRAAGAVRAAPGARSGRTLAGAMLAGWGVFNLVEGVVDHQILGVHHVLPGRSYEFAADMAFLAFGALLVVGGYLLRGPAAAGPEGRAVHP